MSSKKPSSSAATKSAPTAESKPSSQRPPAAKPSASQPTPSSAPPNNNHSKFRKVVNVKPDPAKKDADLAALALEIKKIKELREAVSKKMKDIRESGKGSAGEKQKIRDELVPIKELLQKARAEKDQVLTRLKQTTAVLDALYVEEKKAKDGLGKFSTVEEIDREIALREKSMLEGHITSREEKEILRGMDKLRLSKKLVGTLQLKVEEVKQAKEARKAVDVQLKEKIAVVDGLQREYQKVKDKLDAFDAEEKKGAISQLPELKLKHDALNVQLGEVEIKRQAVYDNWRQANMEFVQKEELRRKEEQLAWQAEKEARLAEQAKYEAEKQERLRLKEAELDAMKPWEEEIAICDLLVTYLIRLGGGAKEAAADTTPATTPAVLAQKVPKKSASSFGELKPLQRDNEDETSSKQKPKKKKNVAEVVTAKVAIMHGPETLEYFRVVECEAPLFSSQVDASLAEVQAKRAYFDVLPRKATKQAPAQSTPPPPTPPPLAAQPEESSSKLAPPPGLSKSSNKLSVQDATVFPTLKGSKAVLSSEKALWGPKPVSVEQTLEEVEN